FATHLAATEGTGCPSLVGRSKNCGGFIGFGDHAAASAKLTLPNPPPRPPLPFPGVGAFPSVGGAGAAACFVASCFGAPLPLTAPPRPPPGLFIKQHELMGYKLE